MQNYPPSLASDKQMQLNANKGSCIQALFACVLNISVLHGRKQVG